MRKNKLFLGIFILFITVIFSASVKLFAEDSYFPSNYTGYRYPIIPGTDEWRKLPDHQAMCDACQIPEEILTSLTTQQLVDTVLYYPLYCDVFAYDDIEKGLEVVSEHFNGLKEFLSRSGSVYFLQQKIASGWMSNANMLMTGIGKKVNNDQLNVLRLEFAGLLLQDKNKTDLSKFKSDKIGINALSPLPKEFISFISRKCDNIIERKIKDTDGVKVDYDSTAYEVWKYIDNINRPIDMPEMNKKYQETLEEEMELIYKITPIRPASVKYNCHSYAWYSQSKNNKYWLNDPSPIIENKKAVSEVSKLYTQKDDIMVYYYSFDGSFSGISHSAVITDFKDYPRSKRVFTVKSKWGLYGLYEHSYTNCPYYYHEGYTGNVPNDIKYYHVK